MDAKKQYSYGVINKSAENVNYGLDVPNQDLNHLDDKPDDFIGKIKRPGQFNSKANGPYTNPNKNSSKINI